MKKGIFAFLAILTIVAIAMTGCPTSTSPKKSGGGSDKVRVTFDLNYTNSAAATVIEVEKDKSIGSTAFPKNPTRTDGNVFQEWNTVKTGGTAATKFTSSTIVTADITVYAQWKAGITISFDLNIPDDYTGTRPSPVAGVSIDVGGSLSAAQLGGPTGGGDDLVFKGWFTAKTDGTQITSTYTFSAAATIFAQWTVIDPDTMVKITFDYNYTDSPPAFDLVFTKDSPPSDGLGPDAWPTDPVRAGYTFLAWRENNYGTGNTYTAASSFSQDQIVYGSWEREGGPVEETPPEGTDLARAEKIKSANAFYVVYRFELPAGKKWSDYSSITADYMVPPSLFAGEDGRVLRGLRLMGNYKITDFEYTESPDGAATERYAFANYNNGKNAEYILDNHNANGPFSNYTTQFTPTIDAPWKWGTHTYNITGTNKHASYVAANLPADDATGPFYFGLGLAGQGGGGSSSYMRDVTLVGTTGTASVTGTPLWITYDDGTGDKLYPVFTGYPRAVDGAKEAYRGMVSGTNPTPLVVQAKITFNLNYTGAPAAEEIKIFKGTALGTKFPDNPAGQGSQAFVRWSKTANGSDATPITDETIFDADTPLYAQWAAPINITLDPKGGNWGGITTNKVIPIGTGGSLDATQLTAPTKDSYRFDKWIITGTTTEVEATVTTFATATTIDAVWIETVAVTFNLNFKGSTPIVKYPDLGTAIADFPATASIADLGYYTFKEWNTQANGKGTKVEAKEVFSVATTVYAQWTAQALPPGDLVYVTSDATKIPIRAGSIKNTTALGANYGTSTELQWTVASMNIPAGFNLASYKSYTIKVKLYSDADFADEHLLDQATNAADFNVVQFKFARSSSLGDDLNGVSGANIASTLYNVGGHTSGGRIYGVEESIPATVISNPSSVTHLFLQRGPTANMGSAVFVEITDFILHSDLGGGEFAIIDVDYDVFTDPLASVAGKTWNVSSGDLKITLPAGLTGYKWTINGVTNTETTNVLTLPVSTYKDKINTSLTVTALASKGGKTYSKTIVIAVKR